MDIDYLLAGVSVPDTVFHNFSWPFSEDPSVPDEEKEKPKKGGAFADGIQTRIVMEKSHWSLWFIIDRSFSGTLQPKSYWSSIIDDNHSSLLIIYWSWLIIIDH